MTGNRVILLSGPRGAGKTLLVNKTLELLKPAGYDVAGILSLPVIENGVKTAIEGIDLRSGESRRLAVQNAGEIGHLITNQWMFDPEAMQWADHILEFSTPCDLLVVDEFGVLEFERSQGWMAGLKSVDDGLYRVAILIIRPELLVKAQKRWKIRATIEIGSDPEAAALNRLLSITSELLQIPSPAA